MTSSPSEDETPLRGLARSIDALFEAMEEADDDGRVAVKSPTPAPPPAPPAVNPPVPRDPASEAFAEFDGPAPASETPSPAPISPSPGGEPDVATPSDPGDAMDAAVERYLASEGARRDDVSRRIRDLSGTLREENRHESIADAVERLLVAGHLRGGQEAPLALARVLVGPSVATVLTHRLGGARDEERRAQLVEVAAALATEVAPAVSEALADTEDRSARRAYMRALVAMGDGAMGVVAAMVDDSRWFVVRNAVLVLGEVGGQASVQHLTTTLAHDDPRVRRETLLALAKIGGEDAEALVRHKLDDPDPGARAAAALALGSLGGERDARTLVAALDGETETEVQIALIRALGQIGDPGAVQALEKRAVGGFFSRGESEVRVAAYRALASIGTPHARKLIEDAVEDRDDAVKRTAQEAMGR